MSVYPRLYPAEEKLFTSNGIGALSDCISCMVEETLNGAFELEMQYRLNGIHYEDIQNRSIILVHPNPHTRPQPFRIYRITRPLNGIVTLYAQHISYDLSGIIVESLSSCFAGFCTGRYYGQFR